MQRLILCVTWFGAGVVGRVIWVDNGQREITAEYWYSMILQSTNQVT